VNIGSDGDNVTSAGKLFQTTQQPRDVYNTNCRQP